MSRKRRRTLAAVGGLALVVVILAIVKHVDARLKSCPPHAGYYPEGATCVALSSDFPVFLSRLADSDAGVAMLAEWPSPLGEAALSIRKATGIRPTPERWRLWMGPQLAAARSQQGDGICVYPGLLLRAVDYVRSHTVHPRDEDAISAWGDYFYAWRDGFVILSRSRDYVAASLDAPPSPLDAPERVQELAFHWTADPAGQLTILADDGIPVGGRVKVAVAPRTEPLTAVEIWPAPPILAVTLSTWSGCQALLSALDAALPTDGPWAATKNVAAEVWDTWELQTPQRGWDQQIDHCAFALIDVDTSNTTPIPILAAVWRCAGRPQPEHPLAALVAGVQTIPYEWRGYPGVMAPLLSENFVLCLGQFGRDWLAATQVSALDALAENLGPSQPLSADVAVRLDWRKTGERAEDLLSKAGALQLVPRMHRQEVEADFGVIARGAAGLGRLALDGRMREDWLVFNGFLAQGAGAQEAPS